MQRSEQLNRECHCITVDRDKLWDTLQKAGLEAVPGAAQGVAGVPPMFADFPVFLSPEEVASLVQAVAAVQRVVALPAFQGAALATAPAVAHVDHGLRGTLYGFDFHLTPQGPRLIEINTNAGGALLSVALGETQAPCCDEVTTALTPAALTSLAARVDDVPAALIASFVREYRRQRGDDAALTTVAIVDESPATQFLYPEFQLFQRLFRAHGVEAIIADVAALRHEDGALWHGSTRIDLVYNRLTDFYFESPVATTLKAAYVAGDVVITPNPRAHALYANKRHLATLSDANALTQLGVDAETIATLSHVVLRAELVNESNRERLWVERKRYFFKPLCGYGSKAAYRGDKLTRKTWEAMSAGDYLAQELATPSERVIQVDGKLTPLKLDVRAYVDDERVLLLASRLYQGQTTNFRTPGGGFASVFSTVPVPG